MNVPALPAPSEKQSGNVLFLILFLIVAVSVGAYYVTRSEKNNSPNYDKKSISVTSLLQYTQGIQKGVNRLLEKGVKWEHIDYHAPIDPEFTELAQSDKSAQLLFHPDGGGVTYYPVDRDAVEKVTRQVSRNQNGNWHFLKLRVKGIATSKKELALILYRVKPDVCAMINEELHGSNTIPVITSSAKNFFRGHTRLDGEGLTGKSAACFVTSDNRYLFYTVLLPR